MIFFMKKKWNGMGKEFIGSKLWEDSGDMIVNNYSISGV